MKQRKKEIAKVIEENTAILSAKYQLAEGDYERVLPSLDSLKECVDLLRSIIFPGYFGGAITNYNTIHYHIGTALERLRVLLSEQIFRGKCFHDSCSDCWRDEALGVTLAFINRIPEIKRVLVTDVEAILRNDPAAKNKGEVILCYPSINALIHYRIAHELLLLDVSVIPRIISEMAHSQTGIDIHPGATIGEYFSIDHGTGVVIGQTCIIGNNVCIYQGVTLGARNFTLDQNGIPIDEPRHPIVEDNVKIYSNTSVLGRVTIGKGSVIGGNMWITHDVLPGSKIVQRIGNDNL